MSHLADPLVLTVAAVAALCQTFVLGVLLALLRPGPRGYFARNGWLGGWALCLAVSAGLIALALAPVPLFLSLWLWWVAAPVLFRLTARQTITFGVAVNLLWLLVVFRVTTQMEL